MAMIIKRGKSKAAARIRRQVRGRKKISGTAARPRLVVSRSSRHLFVQVVDDSVGKTLASASTEWGGMRSWATWLSGASRPETKGCADMRGKERGQCYAGVAAASLEKSVDNTCMAGAQAVHRLGTASERQKKKKGRRLAPGGLHGRLGIRSIRRTP